MNRKWKGAMKKVREKDVCRLEMLCWVTAAAAAVLSVLFLFDFVQNHWFLNFILGLGVLLHAALMVLFLLKNKKLFAGLAAVLAVCYAGSLIYFNLQL